MSFTPALGTSSGGTNSWRLLPRHLASALLAGSALFGACAPTQRAIDPSAMSTSSSTVAMHEHEEQSLAGPARATTPLGREARHRLGLPADGAALNADRLPPLDEAQWADPEAVAARFALVRTNFPADEDPAQLRARSSPYVADLFQEDLASSSGGGAGLADLRAQGVVFVGVVGLVTTERSANRSVVDLTVQRSTLGREVPQPGRVEFWRLTLVRDVTSGHWLVAGLELS